QDSFMARPNERTLFAGIFSVPPGCYAIAQKGEVRIYPYWDWNFPLAEELAAEERSDAEVTQGFRQVLDDAVRERLIADVEVASYLSGGIDSCAVLGLAQKHMSRPIRAFTLAFEDRLYDESAIAERQAKFVGASFERIPVSSRALADAYRDTIWHAETTVVNGHASAKFLLSRAVRDAGIKVVFTGEGSDELFGGYMPFRRDVLLHHSSHLDAKTVAALMQQMHATNEATRSIFSNENPPAEELLAVTRRLGWCPSWMEVFAAPGKVSQGLYRGDFATEFGMRNPYPMALDRLPIASYVKGRDRLHQALYLNAKFQLHNFILTFLGDRMEMAHSIEGRVPFLDHHVAEFAARIPINLKIRGIREKHILREATKDCLIDEVYNREKHPFTAPPAKREDDPMQQLFADVLLSRAAAEQPIFDPMKARSLVDMWRTCPSDQRIRIEGMMHRIASTTILHERFGMNGVE
ncbi:MAG TPA: asparagine synthase C-terminal domain-containing protein, partial [Steroidobacteraceae bacterium]|nr:asparagine synthase C-terminal domain-containing protein [Steroidobacteraceae bacterium]